MYTSKDKGCNNGLDENAAGSGRKIVTLKRRGNLAGKDSSDSVESSLGNRKRVEGHLPSENHRDKKKHEPSDEAEEWGWFVDVPFSPGSLSKMTPKSPAPIHLPKQAAATTPVPSDPVNNSSSTEVLKCTEENEPPVEANENVIGKSNSLLRLWDRMSMDRRSAGLDSNQDPGDLEKSAGEGEHLPHVTSFCFEMDI